MALRKSENGVMGWEYPHSFISFCARRVTSARTCNSPGFRAKPAVNDPDRSVYT